jgi:hypothetical protein
MEGGFGVILVDYRRERGFIEWRFDGEKHLVDL